MAALYLEGKGNKPGDAVANGINVAATGNPTVYFDDSVKPALIYQAILNVALYYHMHIKNARVP